MVEFISANGDCVEDFGAMCGARVIDIYVRVRVCHTLVKRKVAKEN